MTDQPNEVTEGEATEATTEAKSLTDLPQAPLFLANVEEAESKLNEWMAAGFPIDEVTILAKTLPEGAEGFLDPAAYPARVVIHILRNRARRATPGDSTSALIPATVKCIAIYHAPTLETVITAEDGRDWLATIVDTQLARVAVASLRDADDLALVADTLPETDADYWADSGQGGGGIMAAYDALYKQLKTALQQMPGAKHIAINKAGLKSALESAAYARFHFGGLESWTNPADGKTHSLFVVLLRLAISKWAKAESVSPEVFERWLNTRDEVAYAEAEAKPEGEEAAFDINALFAGDEAESEAESA